jgi:hypothetical protein
MGPNRIKKRQWFRILRDLMGSGVSMHRVGKACGRSRGTVQQWAEGGEPKDSDARIVLALYRKHCPEKYEEHMLEYEPEVLSYEKKVGVKADRHLRGKPRPDRVWVVPSPQLDFFFATVEGA